MCVILTVGGYDAIAHSDLLQLDSGASETYILTCATASGAELFCAAQSGATRSFL